jgi:SAM-dependent methyltransferase
MELAAGHISDRLVEMAGIEPGDRVLDVAAGYGEPSLTAAKVVGPDGTVVATDLSAEMIAYGRERAEEAGLGNVEWMNSDGASLDFPHESFDAAISRWGIIFEPEGEATAARIRGFLKPGSRMAISSWGTPEQVPFLSVPMRIVMERLEVPPPPPGTPGPLSRPTHEALAALLLGGGFSDVEVEEGDVTFEFQSPEEYAVFTRDLAAPIRAMLEPHPQEVQDEIWAEVADAFRPQAADDGSLMVSNVNLLAVGTA